jgi:hypothetical protein
VGEDVAAVGDLERHLHVLLDQQHAGPGGRRVLAHHRQQAAHDHRGEAEAHLVQHQQPGLAGQGPGDREHLLFAARHQPGLAVLERAQRGEVVERGVGVAGAALAVEPEVLGHGQPEKQPAVGGDVRDAEPGAGGRRHARQVGAAERDRSRRVPQQAGDGPQRGRLARAVGAEQRHHLAATHS